MSIIDPNNSLFSPPSEIEAIVRKIINLKDESGNFYLQKFSLANIVSLIEKNKIGLLEKKFKDYDRKGVDIIDFVRIFLNIIEHTDNETLYLVIALIELFRVVSESMNMAPFIKCSDITNFICEFFAERRVDDYIIPTKKIPEPRRFAFPDSGKSLIDIEPPYIYGHSDFLLRRLVESKLITDSSHHNNQSIKMGEFGKDIKKVMTMDSLASEINVYSIDCILEKKIVPRKKNNKKEVIILGFAWSEKQNRIGCCLKDYSLSFWDATDQFEDEKNFNVSSFAVDYQINIWYIEFLNCWMTTDRSNIINVWNIESEILDYHIGNPIISEGIIDIIPIPYIKLVVVASLNRKLTVWDFFKRLLIFVIDLKQGGIHSLKFFSSYQVLITAGYENSIALWEISPVFLDHSLLGKLIGHNSMVTAVQCIEKTPIVVSTDDTGVIKLWDIRNLKCTQTVDLYAKSIITRILDIEGHGKLCFLSSRINFIEFDCQQDKRTNEDVYPVKVEFNYVNDELVVCTRKDLRFIDLGKGKINKIFQGLLRSEDDDITSFRCVDQNRKFVIGDHRGLLSMFSLSSGEKIKNLQSHSNEVSILKIDFVNKLFITSGRDSTIMIQKEENSSFEPIREINNMYNGKGIHLLEISVFHNLLVTTTNSNIILIWDYEYLRLLGSYELEKNVEPTSLIFINGYSLLVVGCNNMKIYFLSINCTEPSFYMRLISIIDLLNYEKEEGPLEEDKLKFPNKLLVDLTYHPQTEELNNCVLYVGLLRGSLKAFSLNSIFERNSLKISANSNIRTNYNAYRKIKEDFSEALKKVKTENFLINESECLNNGEIFSISAHKDSLTTLILISLAEKSILTSSLDCYIKMWDLNGNRLAAFNINHPLPLVWDIRLDKLKRTRKNVLFALKIIELIFRRYKRSILFNEEKLLNVNNFLSFLASQKEKSIDSTEDFLNINMKQSKVILMKDEYSPRDLHFENIKHIYQREIMGPSLKEMENNKRLLASQKIWKSEANKLTEQSIEEKLKLDNAKFESGIYHSKDTLAFLDVNFRKRLRPNSKNEEDYSGEVQKLAKKMELHLKKRKKHIDTLPDIKLDVSKKMKTPKLELKDPTKPNEIKEKTVLFTPIKESFREPVKDEKSVFCNLSKTKISEETQSSRHFKSLGRASKTRNIFEYASTHNLLLDEPSSQIISNKSYKNEEKICFGLLLKNIDQKLKLSQSSFLKTQWHSNKNNRTDLGFYSEKKLENQRDKNRNSKAEKTNKLPKISSSNISDLKLDVEEQKIDEMLQEILLKVKMNVGKKMETELNKIKEKTMIQEKLKMSQIGEIKQKNNILEVEPERGFVGLNTVFNTFKFP